MRLPGRGGVLNQHDARRNGIILLNTRINHYEGKVPPPGRDDVWQGRSSKWTVVRHVPKNIQWAMSTHGAATRAHVVRYGLVATSLLHGTVVKVTVWQCAARCLSDVQFMARPDSVDARCWTCSKHDL